MTERIRRPNYGTLEIELTIDDPKDYTRPFTVKLTQEIELDTELVDEFCLENEKSYGPSRNPFTVTTPTGSTMDEDQRVADFDGSRTGWSRRSRRCLSLGSRHRPPGKVRLST